MADRCIKEEIELIRMVEWKKLGEVCKILDSQRKPVAKGDRRQGDYPYYGANGIQDYVDDYIFDGTFLLLGEDGSVINRDNSPVLHWATGKIWVNNHAHILKQNKEALLRYLYYSLQCTDVSDIVRGVPPKINQANMRNIQIPIPSLSEQTRIVGILDTFTSSIENLKQQIAERRKQYEHYRDQLLDLEGKEVVIKTLEEVVSSDCSLSYGIVQPGDDVIDGIPVVRPVDLISRYIKLEGLKRTDKQISESYKRTILKGDEILFCVRGTTGVMSLATGELRGCNVTRGIVPISFDNEITKMFVYYQLKSYRLQRMIEDKTNGTALRQINIKDLRLLSLIFPSFEEQSRIVSILDTFEASISNLEAQLKEREKQYEYYRNKLLTFE